MSPAKVHAAAQARYAQAAAAYHAASNTLTHTPAGHPGREAAWNAYRAACLRLDEAAADVDTAWGAYLAAHPIKEHHDYPCPF